MGISDLFAAHAGFLLDSDLGHAETLTHRAANGTETAFQGIMNLEDERGQLRIDRNGEEETHYAYLDVPVSLTVSPKDVIVHDDLEWYVQGVDGRDKNLKTLSLIRHDVSKRKRGSGR